MIIACPKCKQRHDLTGRKPGETFNCTCGNVLEAPKHGKGPGWVIVLAIVAACSVPCIGILAAIAIPNFIKYQERAKQSEARMNLKAIAVSEKAYFAEKDAFVAAGPVPASIPKGVATAFVPDDGFRALGWDPGSPVRFQYQAKLIGAEQGQQGQTGAAAVEITARGDLRGNGEITEFKLVVPSDGPIGEIKEVEEAKDWDPQD